MASQLVMFVSDESETMDLVSENGESSHENSNFKDKFNCDLKKFYSAQSGKVKKPWTKDRVSEVIGHIKTGKVAMNCGTRRTPEQYYWSTKYDVINIANEDYLILKKKKPDAPTIRVIPMEQYFKFLFEIHNDIGHGARDKMQYHIKNRFYIQRKAIEIFVSLCPVCETKRNLSRKAKRRSSPVILASDRGNNEIEMDAALKNHIQSNSQEEEIHPMNIIREVQKWPLLYTKDSPERTNLHFKTKIWKEIARALFKDWESLNETEKESKIRDLIKRWRNLRDTFKRQLVIEKKIREGCNIKKKTYVYFKHMLFLLPHIDTPDTIEDEDRMLEPKLNEYFKRQNKRKFMKEKNKSKRKKILSPTEGPRDETEIDEDKHFLMSLIPSFKKMSDDEKLTAKVEILKIIKNVRNQASTSDCSVVADVLSYNVGNDFDEVKVEMFHSELEQDSNDNDHTSDESSD